MLFAFAIIINAFPGRLLYIKDAYPFILLSLLAVFSSFSDLPEAALAGVISGAFADADASGTYCFNTIILLVISVTVCLLAKNIFNNNLKAIAVMTFSVCTVYYLLYWLIFIFPGSHNSSANIYYLFRYSLPSAFYSTVFAVPFYFIYKKLSKQGR